MFYVSHAAVNVGCHCVTSYCCLLLSFPSSDTTAYPLIEYWFPSVNMEWRFYGNKNTAIPNWSNAQMAPKDHKIIIISPVKCIALVMALSAGLWLWSRLYNCTDCHKVLCKGWTLGFFFNPWLLFFCDLQLLYELLCFCADFCEFLEFRFCTWFLL